MLFDTYRKFPYSADYFTYTTVTTADGVVTEKRYSATPQTFALAISTSFIGDLVIITKTKLQNATRISNLVDKNGVEIYPGAVWQISTTMPRTSPIGLVEGYKYKAKIISGNE